MIKLESKSATNHRMDVDDILTAKPSEQHITFAQGFVFHA